LWKLYEQARNDFQLSLFHNEKISRLIRTERIYTTFLDLVEFIKYKQGTISIDFKIFLLTVVDESSTRNANIVAD
jgi:hypothetical protein